MIWGACRPYVVIITGAEPGEKGEAGGGGSVSHFQLHSNADPCRVSLDSTLLLAADCILHPAFRARLVAVESRETRTSSCPWAQLRVAPGPSVGPRHASESSRHRAPAADPAACGGSARCCPASVDAAVAVPAAAGGGGSGGKRPRASSWSTRTTKSTLSRVYSAGEAPHLRKTYN